MRHALLHPFTALAIVSLLSGNIMSSGQSGQAWQPWQSGQLQGRPVPPPQQNAVPAAAAFFFSPRQWPQFPAYGGSVGAVPILVAPGPFAPAAAPVYYPSQAGCPQIKECWCTTAQTMGNNPEEKVDDKEPPTNHQDDRNPDGNMDDKISTPSNEDSDGNLNEEELSYTFEENDSAQPPQFEPVSSSEQLIEEFRAQSPISPWLPPMVLSGSDSSWRTRVRNEYNTFALDIEEKDFGRTSPQLTQQTQTPAVSYGIRGRRMSQRINKPEPSARTSPPAYHSESLRLIRGLVSQKRADYSETYTVWYDEKSGDSRVDYFGGYASSYRTTTPDGQVRRTLVWSHRSGPRDEWHCATATGPRDSSASQHPALPDLKEFTFAGMEDTGSGPVELWKRKVQGGAGEQGAARGEVLTTRHEMKLTRINGEAVPQRYKVTVDSSTLGPDCDGYEHVYRYDISQPIPPKFFNVDLDKQCDVVEYLDASSDEDMAKLDPLREFKLPHRDLRYDQVFNKYRTQFSRQYADEREEAVRKNVIMQNTRFTAAGNRQGSTAELGLSPLSDRLRDEVIRMTGAKGAQDALVNSPQRESFPYSREDLQAENRRLPKKFDWRALGAVSPVGFQGMQCASCWAFAVSGAVEGALFRRTRRLVPLSYKCLVDCAHPFGGMGCEGTWPSHAYNYIQERGLPALDEYTPYKEKVEQCMEQRVPSQTRISGHVNVTTNSVPALKVAIKKHAPTVVLVDAKCQSFIHHKKGVLYDDRCGKALRQLHHAVLAVGWGERRGEPHFILKNSWSAKWGEMGYIRVHAESNTCGVLTMPSYPVLGENDVRKPLRTGQDSIDSKE